VSGTFVGYGIRRGIVTNLRVRDPIIGILEDLVAIGLAYLIVSR
jgi:hypothetical protein